MKKNFYLLIIYALALILIIALPFAFTDWNPVLVHNKQILAMYIIAKVIFGGLFILIAVWSLLGKHARGSIYQLSLVSAFFQIVPLLVRVAVFLPSFRLGYSIIVLIISLMMYVGYLGLLFISDKKQVSSVNKYVGKEIPVVEESDK